MAGLARVDKDHMICDLSKSGKLVELGCDPFTRAPEVKTQMTQTEGTGTRVGGEVQPKAKLTKEDQVLEVVNFMAGFGGKGAVSPASQVLRLVVGLLGLEVHERPSSWAEAWLSFKDITFAKLGLSSEGEHDVIFHPDTVLSDEQAEWQMNVLRHLREHVDRGRERATSEQEGSTGGAGQAEIYDWGPDFQEQLETAEFALHRITHAVNVLQDPEKNDRPMILREFTEEQVLKVSADLRQWLEQLAVLLSLYHVYLLDMEAERRRLATTLKEREAKYAEGELQRKNAVLRHEHFQEIFEEDRLKRRAEALLGIQVQGEDSKIYSQKDVDNMQLEWERTELEPLRKEMRDLRVQLADQREKMREKENAMRDLRRGGGQGKPVDSPVVETGLPKATMNLLAAGLNAASERTLDDALSTALVHLGESMQAKGGENLAEVVAEINQIPIPEKPVEIIPEAPIEIEPERLDGLPVIKCLDGVANEFEALEKQFRGLPSKLGANKVAFMAGWARESISLCSAHLASGNLKGSLRFNPPPQWDLGSVGKASAPIRTIGVNTTGDLTPKSDGGDIEKEKRKLEAMWNSRMRQMKEDLEKQLSNAWEVAERERSNAEEALQRLAEETQKADNTLAELRRKLQGMEKILKSKGAGKEAADAIWGAGLSEFLQGRDVFDRLYRDALDRMRRLAESQARFLEQSSTDFLKTVGAIIDPHLKLPGMDNFYQASARQQTAPSTAPTSSPRPGSHRTGLVAGRQAEAFSGMAPGEGMEPMMPGMGTGMEPLRVRQLFAPDTSPPPSWPPKVPQEAQARAPRSLHTPLRSSSGRGGSAGGAMGGGVAPGEFIGLTIGGTPMQDAAPRPGPSPQAKSASSEHLQHHRATPGSAGSRILEQGQLTRPGTNPMLISSASVLASETSKTLPPLECRGQGKEPRAGSQEGQQQRRRGGSNDPRSDLRTGSPVRELLRTDRAERSEKVSLLMDENPPLAIGSIRSASLSAGSLLHPPDSMGQSWSRPDSVQHGSQRKAGRPASQAGPQRLNRGGAGAISMPQLGPPRLLVQSVGSVY